MKGPTNKTHRGTTRQSPEHGVKRTRKTTRKVSAPKSGAKAQVSRTTIRDLLFGLSDENILIALKSLSSALKKLKNDLPIKKIEARRLDEKARKGSAHGIIKENLDQYAVTSHYFFEEDDEKFGDYFSSIEIQNFHGLDKVFEIFGMRFQPIFDSLNEIEDLEVIQEAINIIEGDLLPDIAFLSDKLSLDFSKANFGSVSITPSFNMTGTGLKSIMVPMQANDQNKPILKVLLLDNSPLDTIFDSSTFEVLEQGRKAIPDQYRLDQISTDYSSKLKTSFSAVKNMLAKLNSRLITIANEQDFVVDPDTGKSSIKVPNLFNPANLNGEIMPDIRKTLNSKGASSLKYLSESLKQLLSKFNSEDDYSGKLKHFLEFMKLRTSFENSIKKAMKITDTLKRVVLDFVTLKMTESLTKSQIIDPHGNRISRSGVLKKAKMIS